MVTILVLSLTAEGAQVMAVLEEIDRDAAQHFYPSRSTTEVQGELSFSQLHPDCLSRTGDLEKIVQCFVYIWKRNKYILLSSLLLKNIIIKYNSFSLCFISMYAKSEIEGYPELENFFFFMKTETLTTYNKSILYITLKQKR